jgi:hypothetical protein
LRCAQLARGLDGAVQAAHHGPGLHHDDRGFPTCAEVVGPRRRIRLVAFAEHAEESAVFAFEEPLISVCPWAASPDRIGEATPATRRPGKPHGAGPLAMEESEGPTAGLSRPTTPPSRIPDVYSPGSSWRRRVRLPRCSSRHDTGNLQLAGMRDSSWREGLIGVSGGDMGSWERNRCDCNVAR